jgi:hypothetical protein
MGIGTMGIGTPAVSTVMSTASLLLLHQIDLERFILSIDLLYCSLDNASGSCSFRPTFHVSLQRQSFG